MTKTRNILGLHFGHDGAACVLRNGEIAGYVLRERSNRVKHALGIGDTEIARALFDNATEDDLKAAFAVFDKDGEGIIASKCEAAGGNEVDLGAKMLRGVHHMRPKSDVVSLPSPPIRQR